MLGDGYAGKNLSECLTALSSTWCPDSTIKVLLCTPSCSLVDYTLQCHMHYKDAPITHRGAHITHRGAHITHRGAHITHRGAHTTHRGAHITHRGAHITHRGAHITHRHHIIVTKHYAVNFRIACRTKMGFS